jgi:CDP-glycerol:poly(glycerophosphate) glycerophosphotransferase
MTTPFNLVQDTRYRRARSAVVGAFHDVDDVLSRIGRARARVLFEATSPLSLTVFRPVFECLSRDSRIEFWFTTADVSWNGRRLFGAAGIHRGVISTARARWMKFDCYVNTDFWNMTWLPRRTRRVHLFHGVAGKYGLDAPVRIAPVVASYDRLLFPNDDRLTRYVEAGLVDGDGPSAALVGYPKVDCLVDGSLDRSAILCALELDPTVPTVLYAPTWSPHSSLNAMGDEVIARLARLDLNIIVKLHDRSLDRTERGSGGIDWHRRLQLVSRSQRVHVARAADVSPYLVAADALITDHSSVGFEFMLLDRPIVVIDCPELLTKARINPDKVSLLRSAGEVVSRASEVSRAVVRGLDSPNALSDRRRAIASKLFYRPGTATERAARCIYEVLEVEAPEPLPTRFGRSWTETCSATARTGA